MDDKQELWGTIYDNGSGKGIFGNIVEEKATFGFAAVYSSWYYGYQWLDFSVSYVQSATLGVTPKPVLLSGWILPFLPFSIKLWILVVVTLIVVTSSIFVIATIKSKYLGDSHVLGSYLRFSSCALRVVGMLVLQAHVGGSEQGTPTLLRLLVTTLHFMFHTVAYIYTGGLAAVLTVPWYGPSITTLVELAASNIPWAATDDAFVWSLMDTGNPVLDKIARNFRVLKEDDLIISAEEAKLGFVMERLSGGSCSLGPHLNRKTMEKLQVMKEPLYWAHVIMVTRKSSPFIRSLNYIIQSLRESGIILFWEHDVARRYHSECLEDSVRSAGPSKLSTSNVQGAFFILYTGLLLSIVIFIFEIVVKKFKKRGR
ncbi:glutamate receptor ionotropic, kainate 2-like [Periplaneta americana]|uniref:glutamate receptor ionotropic, kainate 2-like n=1 Tax=Periplaneta americana TaxID=6978 RepID=UPI0037E95FD5